MKILLSEVKKAIRNEVYAMLDELVSKEVPNGSSWKLANKRGWAAKNHNGVIDYWYGKDDQKNRENAERFKNDSTKKPSDIKTEVDAGARDGAPNGITMPVGSSANVKENKSKIEEKSPPGWSGTTKAMKKHKNIDNPFALAWWMKNKGEKSHKKPEK